MGPNDNQPGERQREAAPEMQQQRKRGKGRAADLAPARQGERECKDRAGKSGDTSATKATVVCGEGEKVGRAGTSGDTSATGATVVCGHRPQGRLGCVARARRLGVCGGRGASKQRR